MLLAGLLFDVGVVLTAGAMNLAMLLCGRVLLGIAVAFASVSVTLYNSEMAPAHLRGRLNQVFQVNGVAWLYLASHGLGANRRTCQARFAGGLQLTYTPCDPGFHSHCRE